MISLSRMDSNNVESLLDWQILVVAYEEELKQKGINLLDPIENYSSWILILACDLRDKYAQVT
jgi:hypothetical protein